MTRPTTRSAFDPENYLTPEATANLTGIPVEDLSALARRWERRSQETGDLNLPSSPSHGLRRVKITARRQRFHRRDLAEMLENAEREQQRLPCRSWRNPPQGES